jgi:transposase
VLWNRNGDLSVKECYFLYVKKDTVEKTFHNYKTHLGFDRPYVHGLKRMVNKTFIILIVQIIYCAIHKRMYENDLFKKYTMEEVFLEFKNIKIYRVGEKTFLKPLTKTQKDIFNFFNVTLSDLDNNKF